ncbi:MAG: leucine-rich repeat domain-containing protein, partial [Mycoplasmataceae bacterium]|nr:leucine-rich repeat domain-containing protein [Mycoplasmataceae bacterium]
KNLTATWSEVEATSRKIMILKSNDGFKFEGLQVNETLKSNEITIIISNISAKKTPGLINNNELSGPISMATTQKLFDGINSETFALFAATWKTNDLNGDKTMLLTANEGFVFNESLKSIESLPFTIAPIPSQKILTREIVLANLEPGGAWDVLLDGILTTEHLKGYTEIGVGAFEDIQKIRPLHIFTVDIPNTVTKIAKGAFQNKGVILTNDIRFITFEANSTLEIIEEYAFSKNANLKEIIFPPSLKIISNRVFEGCTILVSSFMPGSQLESIGDLAFQGNNKLSLLILPNGLKTIGFNAFFGCIGLTEIFIPLSVTTIGSTPFMNTLFASITKISIPSTFQTRADKLGLDNDHWVIIEWI